MPLKSTSILSSVKTIRTKVVRMSINKDNIGSKAITKKVTECHVTIQFL